MDAYQAERAQILKQFGLKLAGRRLALPPPPGRRSVSQRALAESAGLHHNQVGFLERGEREPGLVTILALARALDAKPGDLLNDLSAPKERRPGRSRKGAARKASSQGRARLGASR